MQRQAVRRDKHSSRYDDAVRLFFTSPWKHGKREGFGHSGLRRVGILFFALGVASTVVAQTGVPWPEADKIFHSDPRRLGADAAYSVDLGHGRVLWMFNVTFVARKAGDDRHGSLVCSQYGCDSGRVRFLTRDYQVLWLTRWGGSAEQEPGASSDLILTGCESR